jgi:hypothetical protein
METNWAGQLIGPGESYGGRPEHIAESCPAVLGAAAKASKRDRRVVIGEDDLAEVFKGGPLTKAEALRQLISRGASLATSYRALDERGRFSDHLRYENGKVSWR